MVATFVHLQVVFAEVSHNASLFSIVLSAHLVNPHRLFLLCSSIAGVGLTVYIVIGSNNIDAWSVKYCAPEISSCEAKARWTALGWTEKLRRSACAPRGRKGGSASDVVPVDYCLDDLVG
jgi:hypothetical protein